MSKTTRGILNVVEFVVVFFLIQVIVEMAGAEIVAHNSHLTFQQVISGITAGHQGALIAITTALSSVITIVLFSCLKWAPFSRTYLQSKPWGVMIWVVMLTLGTILPAEWLDEKLNLVMPENYGQLFDSVMKNPWGYVAIGIFAPLAEEMVFRGGVLRVLLKLFHQKWHWIAIALSALVFAAVHGNIAQGVHAFVIGLFLGWMYYRTDSIVPGIILHWVNNTVAYFMFNLMPWMADGKLIDLFHGNERLMVEGIVFSFCILVPSIYQLYIRLKKA